ncbi:MAG: hypothetical protein ACP5LB_03785, partial [Candidatus Bathyarchaeia archaeon]
PLFFVPLGRLKDREWFKGAQMTPLHEELLIKCLKHDFYWIENLIDLAFAGKWYSSLLHSFYRGFVKIVKHKTQKARIPIKTS